MRRAAYSDQIAALDEAYAAKLKTTGDAGRLMPTKLGLRRAVYANQLEMTAAHGEAYANGTTGGAGRLMPTETGLRKAVYANGTTGGARRLMPTKR